MGQVKNGERQGRIAILNTTTFAGLHEYEYNLVRVCSNAKGFVKMGGLPRFKVGNGLMIFMGLFTKPSQSSPVSFQSHYVWFCRLPSVQPVQPYMETRLFNNQFIPQPLFMCMSRYMLGYGG